MDRTMTIKNKRLSTNNLKLSKMFDSKTFIFMIIGFLLSRSILIDGIAPLGLAFFLYICKVDKYRIPVYIATLAGTLLSFNEMPIIIKYAVCLTLILIFSKKIKEITAIIKLSLVGVFVILPASIICTCITKPGLYSFIIVGI